MVDSVVENHNWSLSDNRRTVSLDQFHWSVDEVEEKSDMLANAKFPRGN